MPNNKSKSLTIPSMPKKTRVKYIILSGYVLCKDKVENFGYVQYLNFFR